MSDGLENRPGQRREPDAAGDEAPAQQNPGQLPSWNMVTAADQGAQKTDARPAVGTYLNQPSSATDAARNPMAGTVDTYVEEEDRRRVSPLLLGLGVLALVAIGAAGFALFSQQSDDADTAAETAGDDADSASSATVEEIQLLLQGIGYDGVSVEERDGTIYVAGEMESQSDIAAVVTASASLADGMPINTDGLGLGSSEQPDPVSVDTEDAASTDADRPTVQADPLQRLQVVLNRTVAASPLIFFPGASQVSSWQTDTLDEVADILLANPGIAVSVRGYTDDSGPADDNEELSLKRAESVRAYLVDRGVAPGLIQTEARGEAEATGIRDVGYLERRVEFEVVAASAAPPAILPLDVGIIVPSPRDDLAFSQSLVDALDVLAEERGGLEVTITENMFDPEEGRVQARQYVEQGSDVVILHGAEFLPIIEDLATEFPDVVFVTGPDGFETDLPNVFVYVVFAEQGAYVLGDLAASLSDSGTVGVVGPIKVPEPQRYVDGFTAGAEAQGARVLVDYIGSFFDAEAGAALADSFADDGADVLTGTAELIVGPIDVVDRRGLLWFANQTNPTELAPDNIVAAQVYHFDVALREILAEIDANSTTGGTFPMTLGNGGMLLEFNPAFDLDPALRSRADGLLFDITAGSLNVEVDVEE